MLRINLLPAYVTQRRLTNRLIPVFAVLVVLSAAVPIAFYVTMKAHLDDVSQQADTAEAKKKATDDLVAAAQTTRASVDPIKAKLKFVDDVHAYATAWIKLYNTLADQVRSPALFTPMRRSAGRR